MQFKIITYRRWNLFWQLCRRWLKGQFDAVKSAVSNIDLSTVAKEVTVTDFRETLMGTNGTFRLRPLPIAKGFRSISRYWQAVDAQEFDPEAQGYYYPETFYFASDFQATAYSSNIPLAVFELIEAVPYSAVLRQIYESFVAEVGKTYSFPFNPRFGNETYYSTDDFARREYVPTAAPENILIDGAWNTEGLQLVQVKAGDKVTLTREQKYYSDPNDESTYIGSVYVYSVEESGSEITLADIKDALNHINFDKSDLAKQGSNREVTLTSIFEFLAGQTPEDIPEGLGDRINLLLQHFGIAGSYEAEAKGGERTNNTVIDECKVRFQEAFNGLLPTGFTMPNSVTVDNLTYTGTTNS